MPNQETKSPASGEAISYLCDRCQDFLIKSNQPFGPNVLKQTEQYITEAIDLYTANPTSPSLGVRVANLALQFWKFYKYDISNKNDSTSRLNISEERHTLLMNIHSILVSLNESQDKLSNESLHLQLAYVEEQLGCFEHSLAILSDLITHGATNTGN